MLRWGTFSIAIVLSPFTLLRRARVVLAMPLSELLFDVILVIFFVVLEVLGAAALHVLKLALFSIHDLIIGKGLEGRLSSGEHMRAITLDVCFLSASIDCTGLAL